MMVVLIVTILAAVAIPLFRGRIDEAKWTEGRSIMSVIATGVRVYAGEKRDTGDYGVDQPSMSVLGFVPSDLTGSYFDASDFSWTTAYSSSGNPPLTYTITAAAPAGIFFPASVTLNQDGVWSETP
jgi:type II secretory pathway pseudopilin PulG